MTARSEGLQPGQIAELTIESIAAGTGDSVARHDGLAVFVQGGLPGDRVTVTITERHARFARAVVEAVTAPGPEARTPSCPHAETCGGCRFQRADYDRELTLKSAAAMSALQRVGRGVDWPEPQVVPAPSTTGWRERARMRVRPDGVTGFTGARSNRPVAVGPCEVLHPALNAARLELPELVRAVGSVDDVVLEYDAVRDQVAITLMRAALLPNPAALERAQRAGRALSPAISTAVVSNGHGAQVLVGDGVVKRQHGRAQVWVPTAQFSQANRGLNAALVGDVVAAVAGAGRVLELFCGSGNFSFPLAEAGSSVVALEGAGDALRAALATVARAERDGEAQALGRVRFVQADLSAGIPAVGLRSQPSVVVTDPPRSGMSGCVAGIGASSARRVVYVSCDPPSFARDAAALATCGFAPTTLRFFDMFPRTHHLEVFAVLDR